MEINKKEDKGEDGSECWLVLKLLGSVLPFQAKACMCVRVCACSSTSLGFYPFPQPPVFLF